MDAAEDAADAVEHVADMAEDDISRQPSQESIGNAEPGITIVPFS